MRDFYKDYTNLEIHKPVFVMVFININETLMRFCPRLKGGVLPALFFQGAKSLPNLADMVLIMRDREGYQLGQGGWAKDGMPGRT